MSIPELRLSAESDEELTCVRSQANGRFADIHPETCRSGLSNQAVIPKSSIWTSVGPHGFVPLMSDPVDDRLNLIRGLFLEAGRLMEYTSPEFALVVPDAEAIAARTAVLEQAAADLHALASAARALLRIPASD